MSNFRRQGAWAVIDQVLSSGTNFIPALLVARVLGPSDYGAFSLVFVAWFGALQVIRSALMMPYTLTSAHLDPAEWRAVTKRASGAVVIAGAVVGGLFGVAGLIAGVSSSLGQCLLVIGGLAPALALQEFWRVASFSASRAKTAAANDGFWAIGQVLAFVVLLVSTNHVLAPQCVMAWGAGAVVAAVIGVRQLSTAPSIDGSALSFAREWSGLGAWFTADSATYFAGAFGVSIIVAAKINSAGLGLFRVVQNLFGPIALITAGGASAFMPYLVRVIKTRGESGLRQSFQYSILTTIAVVVYGVAVLIAADTLLTKAFGEAYAAAGALVFPVLVSYAIDSAGSGAQMLLRARALGGRVLVAQAVTTVGKLTAVICLAAIGGLRGAAWGLAVGSGVGALTFWVQILATSGGRAGAPARSQPTSRVAAGTEL